MRAARPSNNLTYESAASPILKLVETPSRALGAIFRNSSGSYASIAPSLIKMSRRSHLLPVREILRLGFILLTAGIRTERPHEAVRRDVRPSMRARRESLYVRAE